MSGAILVGLVFVGFMVIGMVLGHNLADKDYESGYRDGLRAALSLRTNRKEDEHGWTDDL